jgi:hypothetical protein
MFKHGDKVYIEYEKYNGDFNGTGATKAIVSKVYDIGTTKIELLDSKTSLTTCQVLTSSLVLEEIWNSPLYKALKEENENVN